ncbi:GIDE domain-containing protein [Nocardiopsis sp. NPDC055824]
MDDMLVGEVRTSLQVLALVATAVTGLLLRLAHRAHTRLRTLEQAHAPPLRDLPAPGTEVAVDGNAETGPDGLLTAPYSGVSCVWFRIEVWDRSPNPDTYHERIRHTLLYSRQSRTPFTLRDRTGAVLCEPDRAAGDRLPLTHESFEPGEGGGGGTPSAEHVAPDSGRVFLEWAIVPGTRLLVHGTVACRDGRTVIRSTDEDTLLVSTRPAPEFRDAQRMTILFTALAFAASLAGFVWLALT